MICPACQQQNPDQAEVCERCSSQFGSQTFAVEQTVVDLEFAAAALTGGQSRPKGEVLVAGDLVSDRYEVRQLLGFGGMGCVYKVLDRHLDRVVALKTIRPQLAADPVMLRRFKQEILLARQITHRNVIRIFDFGIDGEMRFITMEYFEGEDLHSRLERTGKLSAGEAIPIMCQICEGLASAHAETVVHRDLKPQNILINARNEIRILDFGLARLYEGPAATVAGGLAGTPDYMSPEQVKGEPVDARSDLFSAGVVFYEMLTGTLPFHGETLVSRLVARTQERLRPLSITHPDIPLPLSGLVSHCLERDRARRYASASEVLHDLQAITNLQRTSRLTGVLARLRSVSLRYPLVFAIAVVCALAACIWFWRAKSEVPAPTAPAAVASESYVAVLPLAVQDSGAAPAAEGLRESMASRLLSTKSAHAIAPSAVDKANLNKTDDDIARQLGANLLIRGTVDEKAGEIRVRLTAYDARKHVVIWADEMQGARTDLLGLEKEVAAKLLGGLQLEAPASPAAGPPTQNMAAYDLYLQGRDGLKNKRNDATEAAHALTLFEQAVNKDPSFALAWTGVADASLNLYRLQHQAVDAERAVDAARRASQSSSLPEVHLAAGSVYTQTGRHEEAIAEIRRALELQPNSDDAYVRLGRAYLESGQTSAAIQAFQNAVRLNPYYWYNQEQLARAFFRVGMDGDALKSFQQVAELSPESATAHLGIAGVLVRQGKWDESIPEYQKSIALRPSASAYTSLGTALFYTGRYAEALSNFQKAAQLQPHDPLALGNLGSAYRQLGQKQKAEGAFTRAIAAAYERLQTNPRDAMMLGYQAVLHAYSGQTGQALSLISIARRIDPASNELMYDEAVVHAQSGPAHVKPALIALRQALANGYSLDEARHDPDLKVLMDSPEFRSLLGFTSH